MAALRGDSPGSLIRRTVAINNNKKKRNSDGDGEQQQQQQQQPHHTSTRERAPPGHTSKTHNNSSDGDGQCRPLTTTKKPAPRRARKSRSSDTSSVGTAHAVQTHDDRTHKEERVSYEAESVNDLPPPRTLNGHVGHNSSKAVTGTDTSHNRCLTAREVDSVFLEPHVLTGYRPSGRSWSYYLRSAFWLHNETVNVWTHALGCLCVLLRTVLLGLQLGLGWEGGSGWGFAEADPRIVPVVGFGAACFVSNLLSSLAHLLHSKSPRLHHLLFFLDYAGITLYNLGNGVGAMYSCSHPVMFHVLRDVYLPVLVLLCWLSFLACVMSRLRFNHGTSVRRKMVMVAVLVVKGLFIVWPMVDRYLDCLRDEACSLSSLHHISIVFLFFFLDGLFFIGHAPERWWPGRFDVWGQGHQWFHVCTVLTQQLQLHALHVDLLTLGRGHHAAWALSGSTLVSAFLAVAALNAVTVWALLPALERKIQLVGHEGARHGDHSD